MRPVNKNTTDSKQKKPDFLLKTLKSVAQDLNNGAKYVGGMLTGLTTNQNSQNQEDGLEILQPNPEIELPAQEQEAVVNIEPETQEPTPANAVNFFGVSLDKLNTSLSKINSQTTANSVEKAQEKALDLAAAAEEAKEAKDDLSSAVLTIAAMIFGTFEQEEERNFAINKLQQSFTRLDSQGNQQAPTPENAKEFLLEALGDLGKPTATPDNTEENQSQRNAETKLEQISAAYKDFLEPQNLQLMQNTEQENEVAAQANTTISHSNSSENSQQENESESVEDKLAKWVAKQEERAQQYRPNLKQGAIDTARYGAAVTMAVMVPGAGPFVAIAFLIMTKNQNQDKTLNPQDLEQGQAFLEKSAKLRQELRKGKNTPIAAMEDGVEQEQEITTADQQITATAAENENEGVNQNPVEQQPIDPTAQQEDLNNADEIIQSEDEPELTTSTAAVEVQNEEQNTAEEILQNASTTPEITPEAEAINVQESQKINFTRTDLETISEETEEELEAELAQVEPVQTSQNQDLKKQPLPTITEETEEDLKAETEKEEIKETAQQTTKDVVKKALESVIGNLIGKNSKPSSEFPTLGHSHSQEEIESVNNMGNEIFGVEDNDADIADAKAPVTPDARDESEKENQGRG